MAAGARATERWPGYAAGDGPVHASTVGNRAVDTLRDSKVLVTGAQGFIGSHLVRRLAVLGADIHGVSRSPHACPTGLGTSWQADLSDADATQDLVRAIEPDLVFHLAGEVSGSRDLAAVRPMLHGNLQSTVNLLTAVTETGRPRVVLAGSMEEPHPGEVRSVASSPYALTKWAAAAYARMFYDLWFLPTVVLRVAMVYGPGQPDDRKLVPYVIKSLLSGRVPEVTSGTREIDWVYIDDVVDAFVAAACVPSVEGRSLDIGSGEPVDIRHTVEMLRQVIGTNLQPRFGALEDRMLESARIADLADATALLGWRASFDLRTGFTRTVDWYRAVPPEQRRRHTSASSASRRG